MGKNKVDDKKWICVQITHRYNKTQHVSTIKKFLKQMFKNQQILFLGNQLDDQNFSNAMDGYFFIQCNDASKYVQIFKQSKYINNILINFDQITYISNRQIVDMVKNFNQKNKKKQNQFFLGDIVKIKKGMFKNLYAMVIQVNNKQQVFVVFKFISGYRFQKMTVDNCQYKNNLFDVVRVSCNEL